MFQRLKIPFLAFLFVAALTACYRMPTDDDYSMIPMTNNRDFTREKTDLMPAMGY